ncbi:MAG: nuclear transport factor 2 family protein, partial [Proteobacteria bacterium]|nr:nuclear transport factor 2 family protein [Pseudomonadota bacterium]
RGDVPAILATLTDDVDWWFHASPSTGIPYGGKFKGKKEVEAWFATLAQNDDIQKFEPREFLAGTDHVTVLGWERVRPLPQSDTFDTEWVHVFALKGDKICRWIGTSDTAARQALMK